MATIRRLRFALVVSLIATTSLGAQAPRALVGLVRDSSGHGIPGAEVRARGNVVVAISDDSGRFHVAQMPIGARGVFVRRLGFAPQRSPIQTSASGSIDSVVVVLVAVAHPLAAVVAHGSARLALAEGAGGVLGAPRARLRQVRHARRDRAEGREPVRRRRALGVRACRS